MADDGWHAYGTARIHDQESVQPFVLRFVRASELDALWALHRQVCDRLPHPHFFRPDSLGYMARNIADCGRTVGVFIGDRLVAYAAVSFCWDGDNPGRDVDLPPEALPSVAAYDGSAVHPDLRGNGLQRLMTEVRHACARAHGKRHMLGTVSPRNAVSLSNFLISGNRVRNLCVKYGGMLRLIIHADLQGWPPAGAGDTVADVALDDIPGLTRLLHAGFEGVQVLPSKQRPRLRMRRFAATPAAAVGGLDALAAAGGGIDEFGRAAHG